MSIPRDLIISFFFFQAEDGIRDLTVTGVQTCALPISRKVHKGEELTVMYNEMPLEKYMKSGSILPDWDERRSFDCFCGMPKCIGRINRYVVPVPGDPNINSVRMGTVERRGRGMFARRKFLKGEL